MTIQSHKIMHGRNASLSSSMISKAKRDRPPDYGWRKITWIFAGGTLAFFWAVCTCDAQIEANAYITNNGSNSVSVINAETNTPAVGTTITAGIGTAPFGTAATPDGKYVYVANTNSNSVSVIDVATNSVVTNIPVGNAPFGVAVSPDAKTVYVTNSGSGTVTVIDTATNLQVGAPIPVGATPFGISVTPDGNSVYVVNNGGATVSVIDTASKTVAATVNVGVQPQGVAITPDGQFAYVTNLISSSITKIEVATNTPVATITVPLISGFGTPVVSPDGQFVYVTDQNNAGVSVISVAANAPIGEPIPVGNVPLGIAVTPDGKFAYTGNINDNTVTAIDTGLKTPLTTLAVGTGPAVFGSFIGPNIIVAAGGPLMIADDAALAPLGFGQFVNFNGGTLQTTGSLVSGRTISLLALGGTIDTNGFDSTLSGTIINSGALTKLGLGTLTLSGNNSYSGGTNILGGVLSVAADVNLGTGNLTIGNNAVLLATGTFASIKAITLVTGGGTLASVNGAAAIYGGVVDGTGPLNIGDGTNSGTVILSGLNTYTGGTSVNNATLQISADDNLGNAAGGVTFNGGTLRTTASFTSTRAVILNSAGGILQPVLATILTENGAITGVGGLTENGAGTVILGGINGYTGGTTVLTGTLQAGAAGSFVSNSDYTVNGGTLDLNSFNLTMSSLTGTGGVVNLGAAALTIDNVVTELYSGVIQGTGSLTKDGVAGQTLSGINTYTGGTTVNDGTLQAGVAGGFVNDTAYTVNGGTLDLNNFALTMSSLNGTGGIVNLDSAALTIDDTATDVYSGVIQGGGPLIKDGTGTQTLSGVNTYVGGTTVNNGTLQAGVAGGFVSNTAYTVNGGTLDLNNFALTMSSLNGIGGIVNLGSAALTIDDLGTDLYSGIIQGTGSLTKIGAGTQTLSGINTYSGGTAIDGGTLQISAEANLGNVAGPLTFDGGTLETSASFITARAVTLNAGGGTFEPNAGTTLTANGAITGVGGLTEDGAGTLILGVINAYTGGTTVLSGTLQAGVAGGLVNNTPYKVDGGTLDLNGFPLTMSSLNGSGGIVNLGSATLTINDAGTDDFEGVIQGTGSLTKIGSGTQVLSGSNTYSGGTAINGGILQISADVNLGAPGGGLSFNGGILQTTASFSSLRAVTLNSAGGTFEPDTGTTFTEEGAITGAGGLTENGLGTVILGGLNSYTGGTTVLAGTLQAGSAGGFVNNTAYTVNGGTLALNNFNLTVSSLNGTGGMVNLGSAGLTINNAALDTYAGAIEGSGSLIKEGTGTQMLSGTNSYTGGTTVLAGILRAGSAGGFVSNTAYTVDGGTLGLNSFNLTVSSLNGTGGVVRLGTARLTIDNAGSDAYSGVIQGTGSLIKEGAGTQELSGDNTYSGGTIVDAGTLVVNSAQALGLGDVVVNGGVLRADPQPINVKGNYSQHADGTLQLTLAGSGAGQFDFLNVGGQAALDGTLKLVSVNNFQPKMGDKLVLVLAAGGVSGQFSSLLDSFGSNGVGLVYLSNSVVLEFGSSFSSFATTPNQIAVAAQLDRVASNPREAQLLSFLGSEPLGNLPSDFEKISPDSLSAMYEISFSAANVQAANLENRFAEIRDGSTGFTSSLQVPNSTGTMVEGKDGKAVIEPSKNVMAPSPENRWGVWVSGSGDFVNVDGDGNAKGYNFVTGGVSFGLDYRLTKNLAVGVALGYGHTWTDLTSNGTMDVNSGRGGLYAAFSEGGFYLNGYLGGAYNAYSEGRAALGGSANGSTNGGEFDAYTGAGYEFHIGGFTFGPIASLEYTNVYLSSYTESGSLAPLRIVSQNQDSLRTNAGLSASYTWQAGKIQLRPSLRATWQHEYAYSALPIEAQFASGAGSVFTVQGPALGHDSALVDAGVNVQWTPTIGTYLGYDGEIGRSNYNSHTILCSVHWDF